MKTATSYRFHRRALAAFNELADDDRAQVEHALAALPQTPAGPWPARTKRIPGDQPLFIVPVNDSLRAIVLAVDGQAPEVMDFVRRETLEFFAKAEAKNGQ